MSRSESGRGDPLDDMVNLVDLIREPALARIYTYVERTGETTVKELVEELGLAERTAYDYVNKLQGAGFLRTAGSDRPARYTVGEIDFTVDAGGETRHITPEFVHAIALSETDEDVEVYLEKYGVDGLATALEYAREYVDGNVNHRIVARELDIAPLEASIILQALEDVVADDETE